MARLSGYNGGEGQGGIMRVFQNAKRYRTEIAGLALFLTWEYCSLFGCTLVQHSPLHNSIEYVWLACGITQAVTALAGLALAKAGKLPRFRTLCIAAGILLAAAVALERVAFSTGDAALFWQAGMVGGALAGVGCTAGIVCWGAVLKRRGEEGIELVVASAFLISFALYCSMLFLKNCTVNAVLLCAAAVGSFTIAARIAGSHVPDAKESGANGTWRVIKGANEQVKPADSQTLAAFSARTLVPVLVLVAVLWMQVAYFRVLETPDYPSTRFIHYLVPFSLSALAAVALIALCITRSRYLNLTLMFRWQLPFLLISCGVLYLAPLEQSVRSAAFTFDFLGMFGLQFGYWVGAAKQARRTQGESAPLFLTLACGKGLGIVAGTGFSLWLVSAQPLDATAPVSILLCAGTLLTCMVIGFSPKWMLGRAAEQDEAGEPSAPKAQVTAEDQLNGLFERQAQCLQREYGLTKRETEIAAMLLAGRSRPYIRDELVISLNTVHTHAKNILAKCGVHSQQELMDLARSHAA